MKLSFKPFNEKETQDLLELFPPIVTHVTSYKVSQWFDKGNGAIIYGVQMKNNDEWVNVCMGKRALVFHDKLVANNVVRFFRNATNKVKRNAAQRNTEERSVATADQSQNK